MTTVRVEVKQDHLERLVQRASPIGAMAELIWNALDGGATTVESFLEENDLGGLSAVTVADNGHGIAHEEALQAFRDLGDSWKLKVPRPVIDVIRSSRGSLGISVPHQVIDILLPGKDSRGV